MDLFQRFIFSSGNGSAPFVELRWADSSTIDDRVCTQQECNYTVEVYATDEDSDLTQVQVFRSTDNGANWELLIPHVRGSTFDDQITSGSKWYKSVATDSYGNQTTSNILKIQKKTASYGKIVLVYNGIRYEPYDELNPSPAIKMSPTTPGGNNIDFEFRNIHSFEFIRFKGINMVVPPYNTNAMAIHKYGDSNTNPLITLSPQNNDILLPHDSTKASFRKDSHSGIYFVTLHRVQSQSSDGMEILGANSWLIDTTGTPHETKRYQVQTFGGEDAWYRITWRDSDGIQQSHEGTAGSGGITICAITNSAVPEGNCYIEELGNCL